MNLKCEVAAASANRGRQIWVFYASQMLACHPAAFQKDWVTESLEFGETKMAFSSASPFVSTQPDMLAAAAGDLAGVGSVMAAANAAAAGPTGGVVPAAADEVSALTAAQFTGHAASYQAISAAADAVHSALVSTLQTNASCYAATEVANAVSAG
jgi:PE family